MEQFILESYSVDKKMVTDNKYGKMEANTTVSGWEIRRTVMVL